MTANSHLPSMPSLFRATFAGLATLLIAGCASTTTPPNTPPAATVTVQLNSVAYYVSATTGRGTLDFKGQRRAFTINSVGVGGTGGQNISATGKVYKLNSLADFSGKYRGISRGFTLIEGKMYSRLTNDSGVVIYLTGETKGLASSAGLQSFQIALTE